MADRIPKHLGNRLHFMRELKESATWVIDTILPTCGIHMLAGSSGAGKTTWLLQQLYEWSNGRNVLGFAGHPCNWAYISCDRSVRDLMETLTRLGLENCWEAPLYGLEEITDFQNGLTIDTIFNHPLFRDTKFFVLEGFQALIPDPPRGMSQNKHEIQWLFQTRDRMTQLNRTLLAVTHPPKQKEKDKFVDIRSNVLGSASMPAAIGTMIWVEPLPKDEEEVKALGSYGEDQRLVRISSRNAKPMEIIYDIDERGRFVNPSISGSGLKANIEAALNNTAKHANYDMWVLSQPHREYQRKELVMMMGNLFHISEATVKRWLSGAIERGVMQQLGFGRYAKASSNGEQQQQQQQTTVQ